MLRTAGMAVTLRCFTNTRCARGVKTAMADTATAGGTELGFAAVVELHCLMSWEIDSSWWIPHPEFRPR